MNPFKKLIDAIFGEKPSGYLESTEQGFKVRDRIETSMSVPAEAPRGLSKQQIENSSDQELLKLIKQHQQEEYNHLCYIVKHGTPVQKRELAKKMHRGVTHARWTPGAKRIRRGPVENKQASQQQYQQAADGYHHQSKQAIEQQRDQTEDI